MKNSGVMFNEMLTQLHPTVVMKHEVVYQRGNICKLILTTVNYVEEEKSQVCLLKQQITVSRPKISFLKISTFYVSKCILDKEPS